MILDLKVTPVTTDESFLSNQFNGYYTPYWVDKKDKKGGMMIFVNHAYFQQGLLILEFYPTHKSKLLKESSKNAIG